VFPIPKAAPPPLSGNRQRTTTRGVAGDWWCCCVPPEFPACGALEWTEGPRCMAGSLSVTVCKLWWSSVNISFPCSGMVAGFCLFFPLTSYRSLRLCRTVPSPKS
jgi:hypothetical protein